MFSTQIGLELRYGREDEELMGLQFCNEMILASQSVYCTSEEQDDTLENLTETAGCFLKHFKIGKLIRIICNKFCLLGKQ